MKGLAPDDLSISGGEGCERLEKIACSGRYSVGMERVRPWAYCQVTVTR